MTDRPTPRTLRMPPAATPAPTSSTATSAPPSAATSTEATTVATPPKSKTAARKSVARKRTTSIAARQRETKPAATPETDTRVTTTVSLYEPDLELLDELRDTYRRPLAGVLYALHETYRTNLAAPVSDPLAANMPAGPALAAREREGRQGIRSVRTTTATWQPIVDAARERNLSVSAYVRELLEQHRRATG